MATKPSSAAGAAGSGCPNSMVPDWSDVAPATAAGSLISPPMAIRGAGPSPVVPPVPGAGRPTGTLTTAAPIRIPATATATARSGPIRPMIERRRGRSSPIDGLARRLCGHEM